LTGVAGRARAHKAIGNARANTVDTRSRGTIVGLTAGARKRRLANARIRVGIGLIYARAVVQTGRTEQVTVVYGLFTARAHVADGTRAHPVVGTGRARASHARITLTVVHDHVAIAARVARVAGTRVAERAGRRLAHAEATRTRQTRIQDSAARRARILTRTVAHKAGKINGH
jgi:hypothetical protein